MAPAELGGDRAAVTYGEWARLLCERFFSGERANEPVTLFVDDDLLGELEGSGVPARGVESLATAVRSRLTKDSYGQRFSRIERESVDWKVRGGEGDPPALPLLALAVLAATYMGAADGIAPHNYWKRFRDLLGFEQSDMKGHEGAFKTLWGHLQWWLGECHEGRLGISTIRSHPKWTVIGFALSQALFREADRRRITEFFQKIGLEPGERLPRAELLMYFKAWAAGSSLSATARAMAADPVYEDWLGSVIEEEAAHWDGVIRDEHGRRVARLALALRTFPTPTYFLAAERPDAFPEAALFTSPSGSAELPVANESGAWYEESLPLDQGWLDDGLRLEHADFILSFRPGSVIALGEDDDLGCWVAVSRIQPGEDYYVLVRNSHLAEVQDFLRSWDLDGDWREISGIGRAPDGWTLVSGVAIRPVPPGANVPVSLRALVPTVRERPTLRGGLRLSRDLPLYLQGGEPDLWLPSMLDEAIKVTVGDLELRASPGERIELRRLGLGPGTHEVFAGPGDPLGFTIAATLGAMTSEGTGRLGLPIDTTDQGPRAAANGAVQVTGEQEGRVWVCGSTLSGDPAAVPALRETIILPLRASEYVLLGARPGEILRPDEPPGRPTWMRSVGGGPGLFPYGFEVYPPFPPVWVIVRREKGITVRLRHDIAPSGIPVTEATGASVADWCAQYSQFSPGDSRRETDLWEAYRRTAAEVSA